MIKIKQNYNSFKFWEGIIIESTDIRGHMFMDKPPKKKSLYLHTLIFSKKNGIDNIYAYFPNEKMLLGYIQYSFIQEAFYKWIYGKNSVITKIPPIPVENIIKEGLESGRITSEVANTMSAHNRRIRKMWELPKERVVSEIIRFAKEFNKVWYGNNSQFLYLRVFKTPKELCDFVINSTLITTEEENFKNKIGVNIEEWEEICKNADSSEECGIKFRDIMKKNLSEII